MVIEEVITQDGETLQARYKYNSITRRGQFLDFVPFYYKKIYIIDGEKFALGSTDEGKTDTFIELATGAVALRKDDKSFSNKNIIEAFSEKLEKSPCSSLHDVVLYFQTTRSAYSTELWQISLAIL